MSRITGEEFLQSKDIWNHPILTDRNNKECYDVAELLDEYVAECQKDEEWGRALCKRKPLPDGSLPMTDSEKIEFLKVVWPDIHESLKVDFVKVQVDEIIMRYGDMDMFTMTTVWNYKAILYLAQRFELTEV
jgi:hypothetical protein